MLKLLVNQNKQTVRPETDLLGQINYQNVI